MVTKPTIYAQDAFSVDISQQRVVQQVQFIWDGRESKISKQQIDWNSIEAHLNDGDICVRDTSKFRYLGVILQSIEKD